MDPLQSLAPQKATLLSAGFLRLARFMHIDVLSFLPDSPPEGSCNFFTEHLTPGEGPT